MHAIIDGLNPEHAALWRAQTWTGGRGEPSWQAEERRIESCTKSRTLLDTARHRHWDSKITVVDLMPGRI